MQSLVGFVQKQVQKLRKEAPRKVGTDSYGNTYYESREPVVANTRAKRWVEGPGSRKWSRWDPSIIPAEWHGWLHHATDLPGDQVAQKKKKFETKHHENFTGTELAYVPSNHLLNVFQKEKLSQYGEQKPVDKQ
eukprot:TRINITY_DN1868_c0_g1_i1.p1 TRINITY_DN1868_c0_g1~~TRINITY_DN1868_c0_g1_i1.p1  ORF type:complete len:134 (+),score=32.56 TRINITY_DN1868_c0_g1_i1:75-476(+)